MKLKVTKLDIERMLVQSRKNAEMLNDVAAPIPMIRRGDGSMVRGEVIDLEEARQYGMHVFNIYEEK